MKTPEEWLAAAEKASFKPTVMLRVISEIQRDAREGMVPVEDVQQSIHYCASGYPHDYERGYNQCCRNILLNLCAKHPNLFTT